MNKSDKAAFEEEAESVELSGEELDSVEGGKTDSVTLRLVATVKPKFEAVQTANGIAIQSNIPAASVHTQESSCGTVITVTAD
jgi:hypothetical protein